ncbi:hypothetical protein IHQ71_26305 [Rhizobium sp. TH2]|uniref:hypothetical protein n=1 Tax=Rhizobium sp. TH2 TaxID=2775403 RepID=UPI002157CDED|nr:hypothetical protein [Rhizobium sp. TH2]UVC08600.1 hypothetical protein IHQ71_26305 [Rhizobium sp. TH2]
MLISLGHSCQTRFIIDIMGGESQRRMPFDFNITTRQALVNALQTNGASLRQCPERAATFVTQAEGRQGVEIEGLYFWHDYPLAEDKLALRCDWRDDIDRVNEKYAALWQRFAAHARSDEAKTFFLSNTQHNLDQFAAEPADFAGRFGLGLAAFEEISAALDAFGARNYRLLFLSRTIREVEETAEVNDRRLDHRFSGKLSLRPDPAILSRLFANIDGLCLAGACGSYDGSGKLVKAISDRAAIIYRLENGTAVPHGTLFAAGGELAAAFEGRDQVFQASNRGRGLQFSNGVEWLRD